MLSKETSPDPIVNAAVNHPSSTCSCKPGGIGLPWLNIQTFAPFSVPKAITNAKQTFQLSCPLKYLSKEISFASISAALYEKRLSSRLEMLVLALGVNHWCRGMTRPLPQLRRSTCNLLPYWPRSSVGRALEDLIKRSWVQTPPRSNFLWPMGTPKFSLKE